jgi:cytochrome bd-type quinol oxidase subunit 1
MVAMGTLFSSFWILAANSWMQTPAGYEIVDGRLFPKSWTEIVFNPSFPYRLTHTVVGFYVTAALVVVGVAAFYLRRGRFVAEARTNPLAADGARAAADLLGRRAGPQHTCLSAGETRGDRSALGHRQPRAADAVRHSR